MTRAPTTLCKRFWLGGGAVGLFVFTIVAAGPIIDRSADMGKLGLGYDFLPAYVAGHFARTGEFAKMYDRAAFSEMQTRVIRDAGLDMDGRFGAGLNPPHFALLFAPLSAYPYRTAAGVWLAINVVLVAGAIAILIYLLPQEPNEDLTSSSLAQRWRARGLVPLLVLASMPFCQAMGHQQNTFLSLVLLSATVTFWRAGHRFAAGAVCGLMFCKPQVAMPVAAVLCLHAGRRAVLGLGATCVVTLLLTVCFMPGALEEYARTLPINVEWIQGQSRYNWGRQATWQGFWRLVLQGNETGAISSHVRVLWWVCSAAVAVALAAAYYRSRRAPQPSPDRLIAASIASTPLLIPYFMDYDLLLLAVPAVLYAADVMRNGGLPAVDRWTIRAWVALYLWAYLNPGLSGVLRASLTVPLLAAVAGGLILRCFRAAAAASPAGATTAATDDDARLQRGLARAA